MKFFARISGLLFISIQLLFNAGCKKDSTNSQQTISKTPGLLLVVDSLISPVFISEPPDGTKRLFVVDETGKIWIIGSDGKKLPNPFIDITNKMVTLSPSYDERGLLGLAFHPDFKTNGKFYLFYTAPPRAGPPVP